MTLAAAKLTACCDEPHWRSTVTPGTDSGQPAPTTAVRAISKVCSPTWLTQPQTTSAIAERSGIDPVVVEDVVWGCVSQVGEQTFDIARTAVVGAGGPSPYPASPSTASAARRSRR